jgi:hypothetical protein
MHAGYLLLPPEASVMPSQRYHWLGTCHDRTATHGECHAMRSPCGALCTDCMENDVSDGATRRYCVMTAECVTYRTNPYHRCVMLPHSNVGIW